MSSISWKHVQRFKTIADLLIYASIILGVALLAQLFSLVPASLFYSVLAGWIAYVAVGIAIFKNVHGAYFASIILAFLTLAVSLPRPEHYSFGLGLATVTFLAGSVLQVGVISFVVGYLVLKGRVSRNSNQSA
ncbi:MAG TPA: hypothetical protein VFV92_00850 [Candidatus Bathyarchaeia archaeon]|nr:hypothetical protein [Candidatus Bathyarchaeia archaeon]